MIAIRQRLLYIRLVLIRIQVSGCRVNRQIVESVAYPTGKPK